RRSLNPAPVNSAHTGQRRTLPIVRPHWSQCVKPLAKVCWAVLTLISRRWAICRAESPWPANSKTLCLSLSPIGLRCDIVLSRGRLACSTALPACQEATAALRCRRPCARDPTPGVVLGLLGFAPRCTLGPKWPADAEPLAVDVRQLARAITCCFEAIEQVLSLCFGQAGHRLGPRRVAALFLARLGLPGSGGRPVGNK